MSQMIQMIHMGFGFDPQLARRMAHAENDAAKLYELNVKLRKRIAKLTKHIEELREAGKKLSGSPELTFIFKIPLPPGEKI